MFNEKLFWKLVEDKVATIGGEAGLAGKFEKDTFSAAINRNATLFIHCKPDAFGRRWDERVWAYDFYIRVLWRVVEQAVPKHAFESVPAAVMELAVRALLGEHIPGFHVTEVEPDGKWEPVAADAVVKFMGEALLPDVLREIEKLPLKHEPKARLIRVSDDGKTACWERYDR